MAKRDSLAVRANRALQVVENPEFQRAFDTRREGVVSKIESIDLTGENDAQAMEYVHELQAAIRFKQEFLRTIQAGDREVARAKRIDDDETPFDPTAITDEGNK